MECRSWNPQTANQFRDAGKMVVYADQLRVHVRWMIRRDMTEVLETENDSFEFPWSEEDFIRCLQQRNCIGMVAEHEDRILGYIIYELHKTRLHVLNFAVAKAARRQRIGSQMVAKLAQVCRRRRRLGIRLAVRETNLDAQLFFRACGFRATAVLRGYYEDTPEGGYVFDFDIYRCEMPLFPLATKETVA